MNKKILNFFLCGAMFIASAGMFVSCSDYDDDIKDLNQKIDNLDKNLVSQISTKEAALQTSINVLEAQLAEINEAYKLADAQLANAIAEANAAAKAAQKSADQGIADAAKAMEAAEANKANIAALKAQVEASVAEIKATLQALSEKEAADVAALVAKDAELNAAIIKAQARADEGYKLAETAKAQADQNAKDIKANMESVSAQIKSINDTLKALDEKITTIGADLRAVTERVAANEANITSLNARATALENTDKEHATAIAELKTNLAAAIKALDEEIGNRKAADEILQQNISDNAEQISKLWIAVNSHTEQIGKINEQINLLWAAIEAAKQECKLYTDAEVLKAVNYLTAYADSIDDVINLRIDAVEEAYKQADSELDSKIDSVDTAINETISQLKEDMLLRFAAAYVYVDKADSTLNAKADTIVKYSILADQALQDSIDALASQLKNKDSEIIAALNAFKDSSYIAFAGLHENVNDLQGQLDAEKAKLDSLCGVVTDNYNTLDGLISDLKNTVDLNKKHAIYADSVLNSLISKLGTKLDEYIQKNDAKVDSLCNVTIGLDERLVIAEKWIKDIYDVQLPAVNSRLENLENSLAQLITGVIYQGREGVIYYNQIAKDVTFPYAGATGAKEFKANNYFVGKTSMKLFATVNPSTVDFTNTTLNLINSQNKVNEFFKLTPLQASDKLITTNTLRTRAEEEAINTPNGFYEMTVQPVASYTAALPSWLEAKDGEGAPLFALAATYKDVKGNNAMVTSKYEINLKARRMPAYQSVDWVASKTADFKELAGEASFKGKKYADKLFSYTTEETAYDSYMKLVDIDPETVYAFYVDYTNDFFESAPEKKIYDGAEVDSAFKFVCKKENLNKPAEVTFYILNYDGTVQSKKYTVMYVQQLIEDLEIEATVIPGAIFDTYKEVSGYATVDFKKALVDTLANTVDGDKFVAFFDSYDAEYNNTIFDPASVAGGLKVVSNAVSQFTAIYNPNTCLVPTNVLKYKVFDKNGLLITNIKATMKVETPDHLDVYLTEAKQNRIKAAFNFNVANVEGITAGDDDIIAWAQAAYNEDGSVKNAGLWYKLNGAFNGIESDGIVPDAEVAGKGGWTLSNNSKFIFLCSNNDAFKGGVKVDNYQVSTDNANIKTVGETITKGNDTKIKLAEAINYYQTTRTDGNFISEYKDNFTMQFVSPINFGFAAAENKVNPVDIVIESVPRNNIEADVVFDDAFIDYSISSTAKFGLNDPRIADIKMELVTNDPDDAEYNKSGNWGLMKNFKYTYTKPQFDIKGFWPTPWGPAPYGDWTNVKVGKITFDYTSTSINNGATVKAKMYVTDVWGVTSVLNVQFKLQSFQAGKTR